MLGELRGRRYLVYTRVALSRSDMEGADQLPPFVIDLARKLNAEPRVVIQGLSKQGDGIFFKSQGVDELERELKATHEWTTHLLRGKTARYYLALRQGKISTLSLSASDAPSELDPRVQNWTVRLRVDDEEPKAPAIDLAALARSCRANNEYWIFTCDCGEPGCARIERPVAVARQDGFTVWLAHGIRPARVWVFESNQYASVIETMLRSVVKQVREAGSDASHINGFLHLHHIEKALYELGEPGDE